MNVIIKLAHRKEKRTTTLELFNYDPKDIVTIRLSDHKYKAALVDKHVRDFIKARMPRGYDQWDIVDWEFSQGGERQRSNRVA